MNVGFISLGCAKNQVDTEIMLAKLKDCGYKIVNSIEKADIIIVNTCGFITAAKEEAVNTIIETGQLKEEGRLKYLLATGCLSQRYGQELLDEMPELDGVVGISSFTDIDQAISKVIEGDRICMVEKPPEVFFEKGPRILTTPPGSAYLKITEGCNNYCSYCAIPYIRGKLRSRPIEELVQEAEWLANKGIKEIVLVGQDTVMYGNDLDSRNNLSNLLRKLARIDGLEWIRVMYLHPAHIDQGLIESISSTDKVIPYLDIPVQHISDQILHSMNRKHDSKQLYALIRKLKQDIDKLTLRTTVMLGFPGESEDDFKRLYDFVGEIEFDWLGAFAFEAEEGTVAYSMPEQLEDDIKKERRDAIMRLQNRITRSKNQARVGSLERILVSSRVSQNLYIGRGYFQAPEVDGVTLLKSSSKIEKGNFVDVKLKAVRDYDMIGEC